MGNSRETGNGGFKKRAPLLMAGGAALLALTGGMMLLKSLWHAGNAGGNGAGKAEPAIVAQPTQARRTAGIVSLEAATGDVGLYDKFEVRLDVAGSWSNPYDPAEADIGAVFRSPSGRSLTIHGYFDGSDWIIRFAPDEAGEWTYEAYAKLAEGTFHREAERFTAVSSPYRGGLTVPEAGGRFLVHRDGTPFFAASVAYPWGVTEHRLDELAEAGVNIVTYWNGNYDNAGNGGGNRQLESFETGPGRYDPLKGARVDELLEWLEARGMMMNFAVWPHDSLAHRINWPATWQQNAYSHLGEAADFYESEEMWIYQEKLYRYMIARWGHSRAFGIWDLIVEVNGTDGWALGDPAAADRWLTRTHAYFRDHDPYRHPTMGSMAGNREDYWDHAYRTLDIADRENYYDLHYSAFTEDIGGRWEAYDKPLYIGETGNVTDPHLYRRSVWASLATGLSGLPTWWTEEHMNGEMLETLSHAVAFMEEIELSERRVPLIAEPETKERELPQEADIFSFDTYSGWSLPGWADANKDEDGHVFPLRAEAADEGLAVSLTMRFATGGYAQGVLEGIPTLQDWTGYEWLEAEVKAEGQGGAVLMAKPVLFPSGGWLEVSDGQATVLPDGEWVKLRVPLHAPEGYWQQETPDAEALKRMPRVGIKLYQTASDPDSAPVSVTLRGLKLSAGAPPVQLFHARQGFMMMGERTSYGWIVSETDSAAGAVLSFPGWGSEPAEVLWYDPWTGSYLPTEEGAQEYPAEADGEGSLILKVPEGYGRSDIAFRLTRKQP